MDSPVTSLMSRYQAERPDVLFRQEGNFIHVSPPELPFILTFLKNNGFNRLVSITGLEAASGIQLLYHLANEEHLITARIEIPLDMGLNVASITGIFQGATLYEREIHDLLGVSFSGHPDLRPLVLPDDWPETVHPLRKEKEKHV